MVGLLLFELIRYNTWFSNSGATSYNTCSCPRFGFLFSYFWFYSYL